MIETHPTKEMPDVSFFNGVEWVWSTLDMTNFYTVCDSLYEVCKKNGMPEEWAMMKVDYYIELMMTREEEPIKITNRMTACASSIEGKSKN